MTSWFTDASLKHCQQRRFGEASRTEGLLGRLLRASPHVGFAKSGQNVVPPHLTKILALKR
jgi:hypothetical protein